MIIHPAITVPDAPDCFGCKWFTTRDYRDYLRSWCIIYNTPLRHGARNERCIPCAACKRDRKVARG